MKEIDIQQLIESLQKEQLKGATKVKYKGTLLVDSSVILTTEKQF